MLSVFEMIRQQWMQKSHCIALNVTGLSFCRRKALCSYLGLSGYLLCGRKMPFVSILSGDDDGLVLVMPPRSTAGIKDRDYVIGILLKLC